MSANDYRCPYCSYIFESPPRLNRKYCPNPECRRRIRVRKRRKDGARLVVGAELPPVVVDGAIAEEKLPFPFVHYPRRGGAFIGFSANESDPPGLCACAEPVLLHFFRLRAEPEARSDQTALRLQIGPAGRTVVSVSLMERSDPLKDVRFQARLCHRCNVRTPSLRYCHEMYGGRFVQAYGWYNLQTYYRLGVDPNTWSFLPDVCPTEYRDMIVEVRDAIREHQIELDRLNSIVHGPPRPEIPPDEICYMANVRMGEESRYVEARRRSDRAKTAISNAIENITRQEFGVRKVGEAWVSESLLHNILCQLFPGCEVRRHYHPAWLNGLELDIFIPSVNVAFEYQGQQHFKPIKAWGGAKALAAVQKRDARKARRCADLKVTLITVDYTEPLTLAHVRGLLKRYGVGPQ